MKRIILSAIVASSMAVAASSYAQTSQAQAGTSPSYGASSGASGPTPYEGPTSYGTTTAADQQARNIGSSVAAGGQGAASNAQCANPSGTNASNASQSQTCITQENDAIWNPGGVQDDHGQ